MIGAFFYGLSQGVKVFTRVVSIKYYGGYAIGSYFFVRLLTVRGASYVIGDCHAGAYGMGVSSAFYVVYFWYFRISVMSAAATCQGIGSDFARYVCCY